MFKGRSVVEMMVIVFTLVVAFSILATGASVAIIEIIDPTADTTKIQDSLFNLIAGMVGALLGLLAGKGDSGPPPPKQ